MIIHTLIIPIIPGGIMTHGGSIPMGGGGLVSVPIIITIIIRTIISEGEVIPTEVEDQEFSTAPLEIEDLREGEAGDLQGEPGEVIDEVQSARSFSCSLFCRNLVGCTWIAEPKPFMPS